MPKSQRDKGNRFEREVVNLHKGIGLDAKRVPMSGAAEGFPGDVLVQMRATSCPHVEGLAQGMVSLEAIRWAERTLGTDWQARCECKARKDGAGFKVLERWLAGNDLLFLKRDRQQPMVVMTWETYERLVGQ